MRRQTKTLFILCMSYLVFVLYGSLVPLHFQPLPLMTAWDKFKAILSLNLGMDSLSDWVANMLLFIPLAFFLTGLGWGAHAAARRIVHSLAVSLFCIFLSTAIEFTQMFFPPRVASQNDIFADSVGALIGVVAWWLFGPRLVQWLEEWQEQRETANIWARVFWAYLVVLFAYNVLPLDLTISPVEIFHKWKDGRLNLIPFHNFELNAKQCYQLVVDLATWLPVAALLVISGKKGIWGACLWTVGIAAIIEFLQLFIISRYTNINDVLIAAVGGGIGSLVGSKFGTKHPPVSHDDQINKKFWFGMGFFVFWGLGILLIFWYPYNFIHTKAFIVERVHLFKQVPFYTYFYASEFQAITDLVRRLLFFAPLGGALAFAFASLRKPLKWASLLAMVQSVVVAVVVEVGRIALPTKNPDSIDIFIEILGAWMGYKLTFFLLHKLRESRLAGAVDHENY